MDAIKKARQRAGLTQAELAARAGTSQAHVSAIEAGDSNPSISMLEEIARATNHALIIKLTEINNEYRRPNQSIQVKHLDSGQREHPT